MFDFNTITEADEKAVVAKFKEYGEGVSMGKYTISKSRGDTSKWADLIDESLYSVQAIKTKMFEIARQINMSCNDSFLGDTSIAFIIRDNRNKQVKFTYTELYTFLRAALRYRKETVEYKRKSQALRDAKKFVENNKSADTKLAEAQAAVKALEAEIGVEEDVEA